MSTELTPTHVIGPPGYASPDPATEGGRLVELEDHPLSGDIAEDYGASVAATAEEPMSSALTGEGGSETASVDGSEYDGMTKDELVAEADGRGIDSSGTKAEIVARLVADDAGEEPA